MKKVLEIEIKLSHGKTKKAKFCTLELMVLKPFCLYLSLFAPCQANVPSKVIVCTNGDAYKMAPGGGWQGSYSFV